MINYPTLDVFFYELRNSLGDNETKIQQRAESFMSHCGLDANDTELKQIFQQQNNAEYKDITLFGDKYIKKFSQHHYKGYYYPQRLNDTYALLVDCSIEEAETDFTTDDLSWLQGLKDLVQAKLGNYEPQKIIGATWMLSLVVSSDHYDEIASNCCKILLPKIDCQQVGKGQFLNGTLFEYWYYDLSTQKRHHLLIGIYADNNAIETLAEDYYPEFINLFHYRHKILWAYRQSQQLKQELINTILPEVRRCRQEVKNVSKAEFDIAEIESTLAAAREQQFDYAEKIRLLIDQKNTIDINQHNYQERLQKVQQKSQQQLPSFAEIAKLAENRYSFQVQKDYDNLSPELDLLDKLVMHIHVNIALRKEERDRKFIQRIETFGLIFAMAAIFVAASGDFPINSPDDAINNPIGKFLFEYLHIPKNWLDASISITIGVGVAAFTGLILLFLHNLKIITKEVTAILKKYLGK